MVVHDVDGDGLPDFVTPASAGSAVTVAWAFPDLITTNQVQLLVGDAPLAVIAADFTGDGRADLAVLLKDGKTVRLLRAE